jgi:predicted CXXCH cytochrome family protein
MRGSMKILVAAAIITAMGPGPSAPRFLAAQHVEQPGIVDPSLGSCRLCHRAHVSSMQPYLLLMDSGAMGTFPSPGLDGSSESCLRCHWTATLRDQQSEFIAPADPLATGYLGPQLGDDHPIGRQGGGGGSGTTTPLFGMGALSAGDPIALTGVEAALPQFDVGLAPDGSIQCYSCHEPHAPSSAMIPDMIEQLTLCEVCHVPYMPSPNEHTSLACTDCHRLHGGAMPGLMRDPDTNAVCLTCHSTTPTFSLMAGDATAGSTDGGVPLSVTSAPVGHELPPPGDCIACHPQHGG